jgi:hypothetical protein
MVTISYYTLYQVFAFGFIIGMAFFFCVDLVIDIRANRRELAKLKSKQTPADEK